jgi:hypothetical protein
MPIPGERPWLFVRFLPSSYKDYIVELRTPDGKGAYLEVGPALSASYRNTLSAFFSVNYITTKGVGQLAFIDFDLMKFHSGLEVLETSDRGGGRASLFLSLNSSVRLFYTDGSVLEEIPVEVSVQSVIKYYDTEDYLASAKDLAADLFIKLQADLFDYLVENDSKGKYIYHGPSGSVPVL